MNEVGFSVLTGFIITVFCVFCLIFSSIRFQYGKGEKDKQAIIFLTVLGLLSIGLTIWLILYCNSPYEVETEYVVKVFIVQDHQNRKFPVICIEGKPVILDINLGMMSEGAKIKVTKYKTGPYYGIYQDVNREERKNKIFKFEVIE